MQSSVRESRSPKVLFIGAGAIGAAVAAWIAPRYEQLYVMDTGDVQDALKSGGITVYQTDRPDRTSATVRVKTVVLRLRFFSPRRPLDFSENLHAVLSDPWIVVPDHFLRKPV